MDKKLTMIKCSNSNCGKFFAQELNETQLEGMEEGWFEIFCSITCRNVSQQEIENNTLNKKLDDWSGYA